MNSLAILVSHLVSKGSQVATARQGNNFRKWCCATPETSIIQNLYDYAVKEIGTKKCRSSISEVKPRAPDAGKATPTPLWHASRRGKPDGNA